MYDIILAFITAFALTYVAIPSIINIALKKHLYDEPDERKSHSTPIPTLGGIGIFAGVIFSIILWTPFDVFGDLQYILCAFIIIFLIGAKDDISPISPRKKLLGQIFASFILVFKANVRLTSLYGIFGVGLLPEWVSIALTMFTILVIINAFNLIDGINGLSGSLAVLISLTLGTWFLLTDHIELAIVAYALAGSVIAFLKYNFTRRARIFMGDTGALLIGLVCSILAIEFIELNKFAPAEFKVQAAPAVAVAVLVIPLFDTLRVFTTRVLRGHSPFYPDRRHIHHLLIDSGLTHVQGTVILVSLNAVLILVAYRLQGIGSFNLLLVILSLMTIFTLVFHLYSNNRKRQLKQPQANA